MIQLNLMKAKASCDELDRCTPKFIAEAMDKVEKVYKLSKRIDSIMNDRSTSADYKRSRVVELNSEIIALTQGLD